MIEQRAAEHAERELHARSDFHRVWLALLLVGAFAAILVLGVIGLPRESAALPAVARHAMEIALPRWGQTEVVSAIIYGARGFDTFGETFLLLAAVVSVITLSRAREPRHEYVGEASAGQAEQEQLGHKSSEDESSEDEQEHEAREAEEDEEDDDSSDGPADPDRIGLGARAPERARAMSVVVRVGARAAAVVLAVCGIYLATWGYTPGGGFPAGAAVSGVVLLLYAALGHRAVRAAVRPGVLEPIELVGATVIIVVGVLGLVLTGSLFANFLPLAQPQTILAGGVQQIYSFAELIEVATGLTIAIFSLLGMRREWSGDDEDDASEDDTGDAS